MTSSLSVVYIVYNQSSLLDSSLQELSPARATTHVFDLSSPEDISLVCQKHGAIYHRLPYTNVVETVRAEVFAQVKTDYLLYLDADESVSPSLARTLLAQASQGVDYVRIPRRNYLFNSWVKASRWWPDYQIRFFKRGMVTFPPVLHAEPVAQGRGVTLPPDPDLAIKHLNYQSLDEWLQKNQRYAKADAAERLRSDQDFTLISAMKLSVSELVSRFYAGLGYQDGLRGLILSILQSFYYFLVYAYYWEGKKYESSLPERELRVFPRTWFAHGLSEILYWDNEPRTFIAKLINKLKRKVIA